MHLGHNNEINTIGPFRVGIRKPRPERFSIFLESVENTWSHLVKRVRINHIHWQRDVNIQLSAIYYETYSAILPENVIRSENSLLLAVVKLETD